MKSFVLAFAVCALFLSTAAAENPGPTGTSIRDELSQVRILTVLATLLEAMQWQTDVKSYRFHTTSVASNGKKEDITAEFVPPDRDHSIKTTQLEGHPAEASEFFVIGSRLFLKDFKGQWMESPVDGRGAKLWIQKIALSVMRKFTNVQFVGTDSLEGVPMKLYQFHVADFMGAQLTLSGRVWISPSDGLLRKIESEGDFSGLKDKSTTVYSDYGSDIRIEAPDVAARP